MDFIKFPSLTNAYKEAYINKCQMLGEPSWTVTEKVHGANMGFYCDGNEVKVASRNGFVGSNFFNCEPVLNKYRDDIMQLFKFIKGSPDYIIVHGEYFGGLFQGEPADSNAKKVQKGIEYIPSNDFLAFTVILVNDGVMTLLPTNVVKIACDIHCKKLRTVPILFQGSLEKCIGYTNKFDSTIPKMYGLTKEDNVCEGTVIFPDMEQTIQDNLPFWGIKNKNDEWQEKAKAPAAPRIVPDELEAMAKELCTYCVPNRFDNVMSKEGEFNNKLIGKYLGLLQKDCWEEFLADGNIPPENTADRKYMSSQLVNVARPIVLSYME